MVNTMTDATEPRHNKPRRAHRVARRVLRHVADWRALRQHDRQARRRDNAARRDVAIAARAARQAERDTAKARRTTEHQAGVTAGAMRGAFVALLICTTVVATVTFVLSFHGLADYGLRVAGQGSLSPLIPIGVDGLTMCAAAATFLLRHAALHIRLYAWLVFGVAVASSVAGNLSHAASRNLTWEGRVGAAAWPILLALASHLVIVTRRALERTQATTGVATTAATPATRGSDTPRGGGAPAPAANVVPTATTTPTATPPPVRQPRPTRTPKTATPATDKRADGRAQFLAGHRPAQIALSLGVDKRTVERWTADLRQVDTIEEQTG